MSINHLIVADHIRFWQCDVSLFSAVILQKTACSGISNLIIFLRSGKYKFMFNYQKLKLTKSKIIVKELLKFNLLQAVYVAYVLFGMNADSMYLNVAAGIHSPFRFQAICFLIVLCLCVSLTTLAFEKKHARYVLNGAKRFMFCFGFILINQILTPIFFLLAASISVAAWRWTAVSILMMIVPLSILIFLLSIENIFKGLKKEIQCLSPIKII